MSDDSNSDSFDNVTPEELFLRKAEPARDIIFTIILFGFGCLHLWRYNQTNTKYHGMMIGSIFVALVGFGIRIGGAYNFDFMAYYYSLFILTFSEWMIKVIVAYLMIVWSRSMGKAIAQKAQSIYRFGVGGIIAYSIGFTLWIVGYLLLLKSTTLSSDKTAKTIAKFGDSINMAFNLLSVCLFIWQFVATKNDGVPGLGFKRRQLLVLAAHCILIFASDLSYTLGSIMAGYIFFILVLGVGIYTRKALTGFDKEPNLTSCMPIVIPTVAYGQQTVNMAVNPSMVFMQPVHMEHPVVYQHHVGTEEANATTPAIYTNVQTADSSESNTSPFSDDHAFVVEDSALNPNPYAAPYPQE